MQTPPPTPERITHRHVEIFRSIMLTGSVSNAARMLYTSQPTVSRELARLESLLGYSLFERVQGRLRATARALSLWEEVQRSWQGLDHVIEHALALGQPHHSHISVLSMPALSHALLPGALARMQALQGPMALSVATQDGPLLLEWMSAQRFDIGLTEQSDAPPGTRGIALPAVDEVAVLPAAHPLAKKKSRLQPADFAGQSFISLARDDVYRQLIDEEFARAGVERQMLLEAHSAIAVCAMVQHGLGVAIVNPLTARACERDRQLVVRPLTFSVPFQVQALLPLHRPAVSGMDALLEALRQEVLGVG